MEFLVLSGNSTAEWVEFPLIWWESGLLFSCAVELSGLEHNKAELLSKKRLSPQILQTEMLSSV